MKMAGSGFISFIKTEGCNGRSYRLKKTKKDKKSAKRLTGITQKNGYASMAALMIFALLIELSLLSAQFVRQSAYLKLAIRQSDTDLAIYDYAKSMAEDHSYQKRCFNSDINGEIHQIQIYGKEIEFEDQESYIEARYEIDGQPITMHLFYDENGIVALKYFND